MNLCVVRVAVKTHRKAVHPNTVIFLEYGKEKLQIPFLELFQATQDYLAYKESPDTEEKDDVDSL